MSDSKIPLPSANVVVLLASIAVHADEMINADAHDYDVAALRSLLEMPPVREYLRELGAIGLTPVKRS